MSVRVLLAISLSVNLIFILGFTLYWTFDDSVAQFSEQNQWNTTPKFSPRHEDTFPHSNDSVINAIRENQPEVSVKFHTSSESKQSEHVALNYVTEKDPQHKDITKHSDHIPQKTSATVENGPKQPPTKQPPTAQPPTKQPPTTQPPTKQPPTTQPPTKQPPTLPEASTTGTNKPLDKKEQLKEKQRARQQKILKEREESKLVEQQLHSLKKKIIYAPIQRNTSCSTACTITVEPEVPGKNYTLTTSTNLGILWKFLIKSNRRNVIEFNLTSPKNGLVNSWPNPDFTSEYATEMCASFQPSQYKNSVESTQFRVQVNEIKLTGTIELKVHRPLEYTPYILKFPEAYTLPELRKPSTNKVQAVLLGDEWRKIVMEKDAWAYSNFSTCAVVGNGGILKGRKLGAEIDAHSVVIRVNLGPTLGFEQDVGRRTDVDITVQHRIADCWRMANKSTPIYSQVLESYQYQRFMECKKKFETENYLTKIYPISWNWLELAGDILAAYIGRKNIKYRSTGMTAVIAAVVACDEVDIYGFGETELYHYYYQQKAKERHSWVGHSYPDEYHFYADLEKGSGRYKEILKVFPKIASKFRHIKE